MHVQKKDFKALKDSVYRLFKVIPKSLNLKLKCMISRETFQIQHRELNGQLGGLQISCLSSAAQVSFWEVKILYFSGTSFIFIFCIIGLSNNITIHVEAAVSLHGFIFTLERDRV